MKICTTEQRFRECLGGYLCELTLTDADHSSRHDVGMQVVGQPARDLCRHFVQRWNYLLRIKVSPGLV